MAAYKKKNELQMEMRKKKDDLWIQVPMQDSKVNYRIWNILVGKKICQVIYKDRKLITEPACNGEN